MSLTDKFETVQTIFYNIVEKFFQKIASLFGYPETAGMPINPLPGSSYFNSEYCTRVRFLDRLPLHPKSWPSSHVETWVDVIFGSAPKLQLIEQHFYENPKEGYYNFYVENYKNLYFLPDWVSKFLQINCHICLDTTTLEIAREVLFVGFIIYCQMVTFRISFSWFLSVNPFSFPFCYFSGAVDWTEELLFGMMPTILGLNITAGAFSTGLGIVADNLNHLVLTMPYLPSEGEETRMIVNQEMRNVIVFHNFPLLWSQYKIPNELKNFWYEERPDVINYIKKHHAIKDLMLVFPNNYTSKFLEK